MLSIAGTRSSEHSETDEAGRFSRLERRFGSFQRRFKLPQNVDAGAISAKVGMDRILMQRGYALIRSDTNLSSPASTS